MASIIKSNTYADFNGREILTANNDGALTIQKTNYPAFAAYLDSTTTITDNTITKIEFDVEVFDTDNAYDNATNYRFTPQVAGKYFVTVNVRSQVNGTDQLNFFGAYLYKNGSLYHSSFTDSRGTSKLTYSNTQEVNSILDMNGSTDYIEGYTVIDDNVGNPTVLGESSGTGITTYFSAYRIGS